MTSDDEAKVTLFDPEIGIRQRPETPAECMS